MSQKLRTASRISECQIVAYEHWSGLFKKYTFKLEAGVGVCGVRNQRKKNPTSFLLLSLPTSLQVELAKTQGVRFRKHFSISEFAFVPIQQGQWKL